MATATQSEIKAKRSAQKCLSSNDATTLRAIEKRLEAHEKSEKNEDYTVKQLLHCMNARLFRPQRLVSLSFEEEERRCLRSWWRIDWKLQQSCFGPLESLSALVRNPQLFRDNVRDQ